MSDVVASAKIFAKWRGLGLHNDLDFFAKWKFVRSGAEEMDRSSAAAF